MRVESDMRGGNARQTEEPPQNSLKRSASRIGQKADN
jgi:hypothetical protein